MRYIYRVSDSILRPPIERRCAMRYLYDITVLGSVAVVVIYTLLRSL